MHLSFLFCTMFFKVAASPIALMDIQLMDQFGFRTNLHRNGSHYAIRCWCQGGKYANLTHEKKTIQTGSCEEDQASFRLDINEQTAFGTYSCQNVKGFAPNNLLINSILCADTRTDCKSSKPPCDLKFCIIGQHSPAVQTCLTIDQGHCPLLPTSSPFCPSGETRPCSIYANYEKARALHVTGGTCESETRTVHVIFNDNPVPYDDIVQLEKPSEFEVSAGNSKYAGKGHFDCEIRNQIGVTVQKELNGTYDGKIILQLQGHLFSNGSQLQKVQCTLKDHNTTNTVILQMRFIVFATNLTSQLTFENGPKLSCLPTQILPPGFFIENYTWTEKPATEPISNQQNFTVTKPGEYECHATLAFLTCSPYKKFTAQITTKRVISKDDLTKTASEIRKVTSEVASVATPPGNETTEGTTAKSGASAGFIAAITMAVLFVVAAAGVAAWFIYLKKRKKAMQEVVLHQALLNSQAPKGMMDYRMLKKKNDELHAAVTRRDMGKAITYGFQDAGSAIDKEADKKDLVFQPIFTHDEQYWVRYDTQVVMKKGKDEDEKYPLSMNKMLDLYSKPILISESPNMESFAIHWEAIWQEKVGLIIWVGKTGPGKMTTPDHPAPKYIQEYAPTKQGGKMTCGDDYRIKTTWAVKPKNGLCSKYSLRVTNIDNKETRQISLYHIQWPDHKIPRNPWELADVIALMEKRQNVQMSAGLPAILVHCLDGIQRSPSLVAMYLCKQLLRQNRMVDVQGVMGYVCAHRYQAWCMDPLLLFNQFKLIFGTVEVMASRYKAHRVYAVKNESAREVRMFGGPRMDVSQSSGTQKTFAV